MTIYLLSLSISICEAHSLCEALSLSPFISICEAHSLCEALSLSPFISICEAHSLCEALSLSPFISICEAHSLCEALSLSPFISISLFLYFSISLFFSHLKIFLSNSVASVPESPFTILLAGSLFRTSSGRTADRMNGAFNWFLSTSRSGAGRWSPAWGWSTVVHVWFCGVQKRSHDRENPFGRKFLNSPLDTQASFFFYWQYEAWSEWPLLPRPLILLPEAFWSAGECQFADNVPLTLLFFCLFDPSSIVSCYSHQIQPFYFLPPPPPAPLLLFHLL